MFVCDRVARIQHILIPIVSVVIMVTKYIFREFMVDGVGCVGLHDRRKWRTDRVRILIHALTN